MTVAHFQKTECQTVQDELGFTLPFVLTLLVVLSITSVILIERVLNAQNLARLDTISSNLEIDSYKLEQDILWRALLELNGVSDNLSLTYPGEGQGKNYLALAPKNEWSRTGDQIVWTGNYTYSEGYFRNDSNISIEIRDAKGLVDINYAHEKYLLFIAERLGVPSGQRNIAVKTLMEVLQIRSERVDSNENLFSGPPLFSGLSDAAEICFLEGWSKIELCRNHQELREIIYGGSGNITNIDLASKQVREILLQDKNTDDLWKARQQWAVIQKDRGFHDIFLNLDKGLETYIVTFYSSDGRPKQYLLDARIQPNKNPYALYFLPPNIAQSE